MISHPLSLPHHLSAQVTQDMDISLRQSQVFFRAGCVAAVVVVAAAVSFLCSREPTQAVAARTAGNDHDDKYED